MALGRQTSLSPLPPSPPPLSPYTHPPPPAPYPHTWYSYTTSILHGSRMTSAVTNPRDRHKRFFFYFFIIKNNFFYMAAGWPRKSRTRATGTKDKKENEYIYWKTINTWNKIQRPGPLSGKHNHNNTCVVQIAHMLYRYCIEKTYTV